MKTKVFYFSATGNSLAAARSLASVLNASPPVDMAGALAEGNTRCEEDRVVLVFPLYYQTYPILVRRFIAALRHKPGVDLAAVVTRGFNPTRGVLTELAADLARSGAKLRYGVYLDMPNNDVTVFEPYSAEKTAKLLAAADTELLRIGAEIAAGRKRRQLEPLLFIRPFRTKVYRDLASRAHLGFSVTDSCTGCGICAKACALGRIEVIDGKPRWTEGCQLCEACVNLCPSRSIQIQGSGSERKGRYRHPAIPMAELVGRKG